MRTSLVAFLLTTTVAAFAGAQDKTDDPPARDPGPQVRCVPAYPAQDKFVWPLYVDFNHTDADGAYVVTQDGVVFRIPRDGQKNERRAFLTKKVLRGHLEEGLLGFQFDPDYGNNGFVYIYWSEETPQREGDMGGKKAKSTRQSVISRFGTKAGDGGRVVDASTELRLIEIFQPFPNHNGGTILFGPDQMLYVALGDGGLAADPFGNGQNKGSLLGKVLRIDVRSATAAKPYAIPADNPFVNEPGARGEIWTWGMRNPWRLTFDRQTGDLWCGDVGQDKIEEVDRLVKGGNYGWNFMEGDEVFKGRRQKGELPQGMIAPIATYTHRDGLSVTGGYVYRGKVMPEFAGWFVYGDFNTFRLWAVKEDRKGGRHEVRDIGRAPGGISSFAEEPEGELLLTCFDGKVYRLAPASKEGQ